MSSAAKLAKARRRIAKLEAEVAALKAAQVAKRDPASTVGGSLAIRNRRDCAIGFTGDLVARFDDPQLRSRD